MEGKSSRTPFGNGLLGVLILCLFVAHQKHAEALCCNSPGGSACYSTCTQRHIPPVLCLQACGCIAFPSIPTATCPPDYDYPSIVMAQGKPQKYSCCKRFIFPPTGITCTNLSPDVCAKTPGCSLHVGNICPLGENSGAAINEYCKLGCASSVCNAISTLQISGEEVVNEAVEQCNNACSAFCAKGSTLEIA